MKKLEKKIIEIGNVPFSVYDMDGMSLDEISKQFDIALEFVAERNKGVPVEDLRATFDVECWYEDIDVSISVGRLETDEELEKRKQKQLAASERAKKAADTRKAKRLQKEAKKLAATEEKEKELLEFLKGKYESA